MNQNLAKLVIVSDRSGSMGSCAIEAENAINRMIEDQQKEEGECLLTLVEFDDVYDIVENNVNIKDVAKYKLRPRGMTALYDAIGKAISVVGENLAKTKEKDRPALVTFVISTDGHNNASREYSLLKVSEMIKTQKDVYNWKFVFFGAEIDAEKVALGLNIDVNSAVNVSRHKSQETYDSFSGKMSLARGRSRRGVPASSISMSYTASEKKELE